MFYDCISFNQSLSDWKLDNVIDMESMFNGCKNFKKDLTNWGPYLSNVKNMKSMFEKCISFEGESMYFWGKYIVINRVHKPYEKKPPIADYNNIFQGSFNSRLKPYNGGTKEKW